MDFIDPVLGIAEKVYSLCNEVKANRKKCQRLAERIKALSVPVRVIKVKGPKDVPKVVLHGLKELKDTLELAQEFVTNYGFLHRIQKMIKAYDIADEFNQLNDRLNDAFQVLVLCLHAEQKIQLERTFDVANRKKEDLEDGKDDNKELEILIGLQKETNDKISAVKETVDSTQSDMREVRKLLENMKKPSSQEMNIREILWEELTLEANPFMRTESSVVYKGEFNKFTVAVKRYNTSTDSDEVRKVFEKEVKTMKHFESPNILRMFGICIFNEAGNRPDFLIVMEFCEFGSLREVLDGKHKLPWTRKAWICLEAARGLYRLHQTEEKFKVHGCITSSNFLVDTGYRIKLGGFELAATQTSLMKSKTKKSTTLYYSSPQQLENANWRYNRSCEIYSFGIVMWEVASRKIPFQGCSKEKIFEKVCIEKYVEPLPDDCPRDLSVLINQCRDFDPLLRPTAGALVDKLLKVTKTLEEED
ncbi:mixed lineage kinase domain-like protein [Polypterus senegalus]|uniref:mixed lineage kinase domain-like protein n=1 Tax=Polypterus senegalus TaxID=55291 RepID=UPI0019632C0E|nr:mixed lineage kinase domain-like protein [Polypterus senegalus]XP_039619541.1 mixed lineage kinase domain-like protein [Polypterus senegalus]